jgi:hypothetical protein
MSVHLEPAAQSFCDATANPRACSTWDPRRDDRSLTTCRAGWLQATGRHRRHITGEADVLRDQVSGTGETSRGWRARHGRTVWAASSTTSSC